MTTPPLNPNLTLTLNPPGIEEIKSKITIKIKISDKKP